MIKKIITSLVCVSSTLAFSYQIGAVLPLTGPLADYGQQAKEGIELAIKDLPSKGIKDIQVIIEDSGSNASGSAQAGHKLIFKNKVDLILGELTTSSTLALSAVTEPKNKPLISIGATHPKVTQGKKNTYRICVTDDTQIKIIQDSLKKPLSFVVLLNNDSDYSENLSSTFQKTYKGKVLATLGYSSKDTDFTPLLTKLKKLNPEAVFLPDYYDKAGIILRQANIQKLNIPFYGTDGWDSSKLIDIMGSEPQVTDHYFVTQFQGKMTNFGALGYDALMLGALSLTHKTPIGSLKYQGVTGNISFDSSHNPIKDGQMIRIHNKKWFPYNASLKAPQTQNSKDPLKKKSH